MLTKRLDKNKCYKTKLSRTCNVLRSSFELLFLYKFFEKKFENIFFIKEKVLYLYITKNKYYMVNTNSTYFSTQNQALESVYKSIEDENHYEIIFPDRIWTEHVAYGTQVFYNLELMVKRTGNRAKKYLHIILYRMDSGNYELNFYKA